MMAKCHLALDNLIETHLLDKLVQGQGFIWGKMGGALPSPQITRLSIWTIFQRLKHFHFVFYPHTNASWPSLLNGAVILFLFADQLQFTTDVFQDLWLGSMAYYGFSVFCQVLYLLILRISTDGDSFWRLDEQLKCCLGWLVPVPMRSHFMLNVNKPHSLVCLTFLFGNLGIEIVFFLPAVRSES